MKDKQNVSLVDSHCHLQSIDLSDFQQDVSQVIASARTQSVAHMLSVCVELSDIPVLQGLAARFSEVSMSVGCHPNVVVKEAIDAQQLAALATHPACVAIGETGLDYYRTVEAQDVQQQSFREHIRAAVLTQKALIIHTRQAAEDTLRIMVEEQASQTGGVMHCFAEDWSIAKRALDLNFYISFSGILTFKNAQALQEVAKKVPMDRILIETDSPYLAPVPFRGKQNHPALVKYVALALSDLRQLDFATVAQATTDNFYRCFRMAK